MTDQIKFLATQLQSYVDTYRFIEDIKQGSRKFFKDDGNSFKKYLGGLSINVENITLKMLFDDFFNAPDEKENCNIDSIRDLLLFHVQCDTLTSLYFDKINSKKIESNVLSRGIKKLTSEYHNRLEEPFKAWTTQGETYNFITQFHSTVGNGPYFPAIKEIKGNLYMVFYFPVHSSTEGRDFVDFLVGVGMVDWSKKALVISLRNNQGIMSKTVLTPDKIYKQIREVFMNYLQISLVDQEQLYPILQKNLYLYNKSLCDKLLEDYRRKIKTAVADPVLDDFIERTTAMVGQIQINEDRKRSFRDDLRTRLLSEFVIYNVSASELRDRALDKGQPGFSRMIRFRSQNRSSGQAKTGSKDTPLVQYNMYYQVENIVNQGEDVSSWGMSWFWSYLAPSKFANVRKPSNRKLVNTTVEISRVKFKMTIGFVPNVDKNRSFGTESTRIIRNTVIDEILCKGN
ncbi:MULTISPECIES: hypothetical protein [Lacticaseibacillus]|uniref:hypothetical protein n=1 Tax=Lacticaseibacillus TaxID=2759736 RepID=UPI00063DD440|nr:MULTISPECIES: hypothetical protein [Lacticaseibacillus]KLI76892.1 hypothetical protein AAW28_02420 [Lacticaseibacillus casei]